MQHQAVNLNPVANVPPLRGVGYDQIVDDYLTRKDIKSRVLDFGKILALFVGGILISVFSLRGNIADLQSSINTLQIQNNQLSSQLIETQGTASQLTTQLKALQNDYNVITSASANVNNALSHCEAVNATVSANVQTLNQQVITAQSNIALVQTQASQFVAKNSVKPPTITTSGTSGGGTGTYTTPTGVLYLRVRMVGGGGGGSSNDPTVQINGGQGGTTSFGSTMLTAYGGQGGTSPIGQGSGTGGTGGSVSIGTQCGGGCQGVSMTGSGGVSSGGLNGNANIAVWYSATQGGNSPFGGAAPGSIVAQYGLNASPNSGSGGAGSSSSSNAYLGYSGSGGGSGGYIDYVISAPLSSYPYTVGSGGLGGVSTTAKYSGGNGASGVIIVEEHYQ